MERVAYQGRIDVVQHEQPRARTGLVGQQVVGRAVQCRLQRDVAQGRPADAQHHQVPHVGAVLGHQGLDLRGIFRVGGQLGVSKPVLAGVLLHDGLVGGHQPVVIGYGHTSHSCGLVC